MNPTIEDSKEFIEIVGGDTIVLEDGRLEMPPEQAKRMGQEMINAIRDGIYSSIKVEKALAENDLTKEQVATLVQLRNRRKTEKSIARRISKSQNTIQRKEENQIGR